MHLSEILIPLSFFAMIFGIVYLYFSTRNRERMALIEKGEDASLFVSSKKNAASFWSVMLPTVALLMIGIGLGVFTASTLTSFGVDEEVAFPGTIFLFSGIGILGAFFMIKRMKEKEKSDLI